MNKNTTTVYAETGWILLGWVPCMGGWRLPKDGAGKRRVQQ